MRSCFVTRVGMDASRRSRFTKARRTACAPRTKTGSTKTCWISSENQPGDHAKVHFNVSPPARSQHN